MRSSRSPASLMDRLLSHRLHHSHGNAFAKQVNENASINTSTGSTASSRSVKEIQTPRSVLLYLIRHGEASHNVLEKAAKCRAKQQAEAQGLSKEECLERMEQARIAALCDEALRDAHLSPQGQQDAHLARQRLEDLMGVYPKPSKVLVSPLTRTLETADRIFPHHDHLIVREELQERQTGKPCDCRRHSDILIREPSFRRFRMDSLRDVDCLRWREESIREDDDHLDDCSDHSGSSSLMHEDMDCHHFIRPPRRWTSDVGFDRPHMVRTLSEVEEDKASLRVRTRKLLCLLDEEAMAIVGHKGYFRELERGTFQNPSATEMGNGEVRVYRVQLDEEDGLIQAERLA
eukprot:Nitzschia sp. Nitz4//scaffold120_size68122//41535//42575//NITZ4_006048-RA/size68122-processed-gene-0.49-mRNA-1//-1//CDS//3329534290//390//frame0